MICPEADTNRKGEDGMKVLVTGGSGFLGRRITGYLETLGWKVLAPNHGQLDIIDVSALRAWFDRNTPEAVIHTAAVSDTGLCQRKPEWSEHINVEGCVNLAELCREYGSKLVICSSDQVYFGSALSGPHRETEVLSPGNIYGCQKLRAEQRCLEMFPQTVCLRLSWMYARNHYPGHHGHFLSTLKAALVDESKPLSWPVHDRRGLTDVEYVVKNLPDALKLDGGVWNFGSENDSSTYETVKKVLTELGMKSALTRLKPDEEAFAEHPRDISMDMTKLKAAGIHFPTTKNGLRWVLQSDTGMML